MLYHEISALYEQRNLQAITQSEQQFGAYCRLIARSLLRNEQDVDACVSDTWTRAWETVPLESPANLKLHIGKLTRSLAIERLAECAPDAYGEQVSAVLAELGEIASPNAQPCITSTIPQQPNRNNPPTARMPLADVFLLQLCL